MKKTSTPLIKVPIIPTSAPQLSNAKESLLKVSTTASPDFSSPPVDGKWYPIIAEENAYLMQNKYKERQNIDDTVTKDKNSGTESNNEKYVEAPMTYDKELKDNAMIPRNDDVKNIVYAHESNEGHHSTTFSPTY